MLIESPGNEMKGSFKQWKFFYLIFSNLKKILKVSR